MNSRDIRDALYTPLHRSAGDIRMKVYMTASLRRIFYKPRQILCRVHAHQIVLKNTNEFSDL